MGDFYELFFEDAKIAAPILDIALTARGKGTATEAPMCGVPHHALGRMRPGWWNAVFAWPCANRWKTPASPKAWCAVKWSGDQSRNDHRSRTARSGVRKFLAALAGLPGGSCGVALADLSTGGLLLSRSENSDDRRIC